MSDPKCEHCDREDILQENAAILTQYDAVTKERDILKATLKATTRADDQIQNDAAAEIKSLTAERDALRADANRAREHLATAANIIESLKAEVERLKEQVGQIALADYMKGEEITRREATERRLREALEKYGSHLIDCEDADTGKCTCGYRDALKPV